MPIPCRTSVATAAKQNRAVTKMCSLRFSTRIMYNDACRRLCFDSANNFCLVYLLLLTCAPLFPAYGRRTHKDALDVPIDAASDELFKHVRPSRVTGAQSLALPIVPGFVLGVQRHVLLNLALKGCCQTSSWDTER